MSLCSILSSLYMQCTCVYLIGSETLPSCLSLFLPSPSPNGAVLALQSFRCFKDSSEADISAYYGRNAAIAFWLLGKSHRLLHNTREASKHFRSCLKFNPFLWSAYEALCNMGKSAGWYMYIVDEGTCTALLTSFITH